MRKHYDRTRITRQGPNVLKGQRRFEDCGEWVASIVAAEVPHVVLLGDNVQARVCWGCGCQRNPCSGILWRAVVPKSFRT
jgi:hypothetical protein